MTCQKISPIIKLLKRPNSALREISEGSEHYFASAVVIFAISSGLSFYSSYANIASIIEAVGHEWSAVIYAIESARTVTSTLAAFAAVFYIGRRFGGTLSFKKIFSILSHCLIPIMIGMVIVLPSMWVFYESVEDYLSGAHDVYDAYYPLGYVLTPSTIFGFIVLPFVAWSVMLAVKAVKIVDGFGAKKSFGILALSGVAMYLFLILYNVLSSVIFYLHVN